MARKKILWLSIVLFLLKHNDFASASVIKSYSGTIIEANNEEQVNTEDGTGIKVNSKDVGEGGTGGGGGSQEEEPGPGEGGSQEEQPGPGQGGSQEEEPGPGEGGSQEEQPGPGEGGSQEEEPGPGQGGSQEEEPGPGEGGSQEEQPGPGQGGSQEEEPGPGEEGSQEEQPGPGEGGSQEEEPGPGEGGSQEEEPGPGEGGSQEEEPGPGEGGSQEEQPGPGEGGSQEEEPGPGEGGSQEEEPGPGEGGSQEEQPGPGEGGSQEEEPGPGEGGSQEEEPGPGEGGSQEEEPGPGEGGSQEEEPGPGEGGSEELEDPVPIIQITQGNVRGIIMKNDNDNDIYGYLSIPYAKPPIEELRFRDPQPADNMGERNPEDLPVCASIIVGGVEDCLYLNVYTPSFDPESETEVPLKPVMVYIHGGSFMVGSGRSDVLHPRYLLTEDIILVVINYRLGLFGFFNLEDTSLGTTGNAGLKDQVMALRWVKENIKNFGGDPENVCLFGQSAGAASVHLHMLSPLSEGLFSRVIIQSGTALSPWTYGERNNGIRLAEALEIDTEDLPAMLAELTLRPASDIITAFASLTPNEDNLLLTAGPIIEAEDVTAPFLDDDPNDIMEAGNYYDVPVMIGSTDAEGIFMVPTLSVPGFSIDISYFLPRDLGIERETDAAEDVVTRITNFYFDGEVSMANIDGFIRLITDAFFGFPAYRSAWLLSKKSDQPIYYYKFTADTNLNVFKLSNTETAKIPGASHSDELGYLFFNYQMIPEDVEDPGEAARARVIQLWTSFAKTGTPSESVPEPATESEGWIPFETETSNYANIGTENTVAGVDPNEGAMELWSAIYDDFFRSSAVSLQLPSIMLALALAIIQIVYNYN